MLTDEELIEMYKVNLLLIKEHGFSLTELEDMLPYERTIYLNSLVEYLEEKRKRMERTGSSL